jgi:carboxymethylenebutenolidase
MASLPLAAILADSRLARAEAETLTKVTTKTKDGREVEAALALPGRAKAPGIILIHEWWGLNDQIKAVAADLAREGFAALAIDLYNGKVTSDATEARQLVGGIKPEEAEATLAAWIPWLRAHPSATGNLGTMGWCMGGAWSLNASIAQPVEATVIYYGRCNLPTAQLAKLKGPVIGHFGTRDKYINAEMVGVFEANMKEAGKPYQVYWYEADHAFANPTGNNFVKAEAQLAWSRTQDFLRKTLG